MPRKPKPEPPWPSQNCKPCGRCKVPKPVGEFYRDAKATDGRQSYCKNCKRILAPGYKHKPPSTESLRVQKKEAWRRYVAKPENRAKILDRHRSVRGRLIGQRQRWRHVLKRASNPERVAHCERMIKELDRLIDLTPYPHQIRLEDSFI